MKYVSPALLGLSGGLIASLAAAQCPPEDGSRLSAVNGCAGYVHCRDGAQIPNSAVTSCPPGTLFNDDLQYCDHEINVNCGSPLVPNEPTIAPPVEPPSGAPLTAPPPSAQPSVSAPGEETVAPTASSPTAAPPVDDETNPPPGSSIVLKSDVADLEAAITQAFGFRPGYNEPCEPCDLGDRIGECVRLTFHDSAGGGGGSNGCIDFFEPDNNGLGPAVSLLRPVCAQFLDKGISFADCYVVAGALAISFATTNSNTGPNQESFVPETITEPLHLPTRFGRLDAATCSDVGELPHADDSWAEMRSFFVGKFGLTNDEIVAIMGAHTLGRAERANLGFEGGWTNYQSSFSNLFYVMMVSRDWRRDCVRDPNPTPVNCIDHQWLEPRPHLALTVDVELIISPTGGCNHFGAETPVSEGPRALAGNSCPLNAAGVGPFQKFAAPGGTRLWWSAFATAWRKVTEAGHRNLVDPV